MNAPRWDRLRRRAARRLMLRDVLGGASLGVGLAIAIAIAAAIAGETAPVWAGGAAIALGGLAGLLRPRPDVPQLLDRATPEARNILVTADEILRARGTAPVTAPVAVAVVERADRVAGAVHLPAILPLRRPVAIIGGLVVVWAALVAADRAGVTIATPPTGPSSPTAARIDGIDVTITPPAYAGQPSRSVNDPARIEALAGSRLRIAVRADAESLSIETVTGQRLMPRDTDGRFVADLLADGDGFVAVEPWSAAGIRGARRLMGLTVTPDATPTARLVTPGRDLLVPDAARRIEVVAEAEDDLGLRTLRVPYTKVSGSGEDFTFIEGDIAVTVERLSARRWRARGVLRLDTLGLEPGDMVVYRALVTDHRPAASPGESDSHIVELTAPGAVAASGFALDDEGDRYAISQQMVIQKTERLLARRASMPADSFAVAARTIAAEQRSVRAEFVFMMGGELAQDVVDAAGMDDLGEHVEAEAEDDILAGRLANRGRIDIVRAIRSMSRASATLDTAAVEAALAHERTALVFLQAAFSRTQYILRALTERERLDPDRRLTGALADASGTDRPADRGIADVRVVALRAALADVASAVGAPQDAARRLHDAAQSLLRIDPASPALQTVADAVARAASAIDRGATDEARRAADDAASRLATMIRALLPMAASVRASAGGAAVDGALVDALRGRAGGRRP